MIKEEGHKSLSTLSENKNPLQHYDTKHNAQISIKVNEACTQIYKPNYMIFTAAKPANKVWPNQSILLWLKFKAVAERITLVDTHWSMEDMVVMLKAY